jgi:hypothetical protein
MTFRIVHPLLTPEVTQSRLTVQSLMDELDRDGVQFLLAAQKMALLRQTQESPICVPPVAALFGPQRSSEITRTDFLTAAIAIMPGVLGLTALQDFSLDDLSISYQRRINAIDAPDAFDAFDAKLPVTFDRPVAWSLHQLRRFLSGKMTVVDLLSTLDLEGALALLDCDDQYTEGLLKPAESAMRILCANGALSGRGTGVLPAYFDHDSLLLEVNRAMATSNGVVICSAGPQRGSHALAEAWLVQQADGAKFSSDARGALAGLDGRRQNQDLAMDETFSVIDRPRAGYSWRLRVSGGGASLPIYERAVEPDYIEFWRNDLVNIAEDHLAEGDQSRLLLVLPSHLVPGIMAMHPVYDNLPRVEMAAPNQQDALVRWWCQVPLIARRTGLQIRLAELAYAFTQASIEDRMCCHWGHIAATVWRCRYATQLMQYYSNVPVHRADWQRAVSTTRWQQPLTEALAAMVGKYASDQRWQQLVEADELLFSRPRPA